MSAWKLFVAGGLGFWGPELVLYPVMRHQADVRILTILLPLSLGLLYLLISILRRRDESLPSAAFFLVLGVWVLGPAAMGVSNTFLGAGLHAGVLVSIFASLLGLFPVYTFIAATYDGSLYALTIVSILMPVLHLLFERKNWILPPRWTRKNHSTT